MSSATCSRSPGSERSKVLDSQLADAATDPRTYEEVDRYRVALQYEDSDGVLEKIASAETPITQIPETTASVRNIISAYRDIREFLSTRILHGRLSSV
ncbi:MAG: hypothetical protein ACREQ8_16975, partial [Woeseiaceae bacterium]